MLLKNLLKNRVTTQFENAKLDGLNPRSVRKGYFFIKDVNYRVIGTKGEHPVATIHWKEKEQEQFIKDLTFEVIISTLKIGEPLDYINLVNRTFLIHDVTVESNTNVVKCNYSFISQKPNFTTLDILVLGSLGTSSNLNEAYNNWESNLGIDLSDAIALEAADCSAYDDPEDNVDHFPDDNTFSVPNIKNKNS